MVGYEGIRPVKYVNGKKTLTLSHEDMTWAARGIYREGGDHPDTNVMSAYLWAIMRRCLLKPSRMTYGQMWRAFSQPINPMWRRGGLFCGIGGKYAGTEACSERRLQRRARIVDMSWLTLPVCIRDAVVAFAIGELPKPETGLEHRTRISNWASYPGVEIKYPWGVEIGKEWFFEDKKLRPGDVEVQHEPVR